MPHDAMPDMPHPQEAQTVSCMRCSHHFITFDPGFPYGCRAMNFKSRRLPQYEVLGASQQICQYFHAKTAQNQAPAGRHKGRR